MSTSARVLNFSVGGHLCAMPLTFVERVVRIMALQEVPGSPPYVSGLMDMHGTKFPVCDLGALIANHTVEVTVSTPVLICQEGGQYLGLIVEQVIGVEEVDNADINDESEAVHIGLSWINKSVNTSSGPSLYIDAGKLFSVGVNHLIDGVRHEAG